jgi:two-component system, cell cycle sensor histidine kinase and response regulator CckA
MKRHQFSQESEMNLRDLRVLIVEDSEDDTFLVLRALRRGGYNVDYLQVDTPLAMHTALEQETWDIVIADYTLPAFSAPDALKLLQSQRQDLPFIIVSGTIGEEVAVAAMKAGAHDYLIKGNLTRLVPAVERELREAAERQIQRQTLQALLDTEQKIREQAALINIASDAIFLCDLDNHIIFWNHGAERLYGWTAEEVSGKKASSLLYRELLPQVAEIPQVVFDQGEWQGELQKINKDDVRVIVATRLTLVRDDDGRPQSILSVDTDITEKKQLEAQFLRVQRLESLGTLASGIAHDFNNILTPILAIAQMMSMKSDHGEEQRQHLLKIIEDSARRGAGLVKQILAFAQGVEGERLPLQVRHLLSEMVQVARQTFPKTIEIEINIPTTDLWLVNADTTQLHQVLMNLCINARDAMPDGGTLSLAAENRQITESYARSNLEARAGAHVVMTIMDTGTGIPIELLDRVFDPFFTTKELGKGTGLGLSTVLGIVKNHGGFVKVSSEIGKGTKFRVYLPAIADTVPVLVRERSPSLGNQELILIVDDEPLIQQVTQVALETHNYRTLLANNGMEAIELYKKHQSEIIVVLMDSMMPSMDGLTAYHILKKLNPQVRVIATSGLTSNSLFTEGPSIGVKAFLAKPYMIEELIDTLQEVLNTD